VWPTDSRPALGTSGVARKAGLRDDKIVEYHGSDALVYRLDLAPTS
jgi:hypothetical protein